MEYSRDGGRGTVYALQNVDLTIPAGAKVALVGRNGSGKSTLLCALLGMNRRSMVGGTLRVGGKDVRQWSQAALNQRIGFCFQDIFAYPGTVLQNVALCNRENPDAELAWRAARMIGAHDLLEEIGLHTLLEAGGNELSGGQRQRLAVLRAVYQALEGRVGLWVGDECTSAVDAVAAMRLYQGILALPCTVLLSVHSLRLARLVGQAQGGIIVVMDEGKILEVGTHDELIVRRGRYYDLLILEGLLQAI